MDLSHLPLNTMPSRPAHFSLAPDQPPWCESTIVPVCGDLVQTARRPLRFTSVPLSGPVIMHRMLSGLSGSTCGPLSNTYLAPNPRPPMYLRAFSSSIGLYSDSPTARSTQATRLR